MDYNSSKNQAIKGKLVDRHVVYCQTSVVEELIGNNIVSDDITNHDRYEVELSSGYWDGTYTEQQEKITELRDALAVAESELSDEETANAIEEDETKRHYRSGVIENLQKQVDDLEEDIDKLEDAEIGWAEVLEWWLVDSWLYERLEESGECVLEDLGSQWWGRTCSGQAIMLDHVISEICERMEFLDGQKREWEV